MFRFIITATLLTLLSACTMQVYKLNVQQGNIVTQEMLDKLKPGMDKRQIAYIMGNPVLKDTFSTRHWDYLYRQERRATNIKQYHIRVHFDQAQKYSHFEGALDEAAKLEPVAKPEQAADSQEAGSQKVAKPSA